MKVFQAVILSLCLCVCALAFKVYTQSQELRSLRELDPVEGTAVKPGKSDSLPSVDGASLQPAPQSNATLSQKLADREAEIQKLRSMLSDVLSRTEPTETKPDGSAERKSDSVSMMANMRKMLKDPATRGVMRAQSKLALDMNYGDLFEDMLVTPEELEDFKDLLVDKQMAMMETMQDFSLGDGSKDKERSDRLKEIDDEYSDKIRLAIGENNYETYRQYEETLPDRMQVNVFKQQLSSSDRLTQRQEEDLVSAMHDERTSFYASFSKDQEQVSAPVKLTAEEIKEKIDHLSTLRDNYINRAQDILSEFQLIQFEKNAEQWRGMQEMSIRMSQQSFSESESAEE